MNGDISFIQEPIPVIDLFSGPGGLSEGFAGCRDDYQKSRYRVVLSVESDEADTPVTVEMYYGQSDSSRHIQYRLEILRRDHH